MMQAIRIPTPLEAALGTDIFKIVLSYYGRDDLGKIYNDFPIARDVEMYDAPDTCGVDDKLGVMLNFLNMYPNAKKFELDTDTDFDMFRKAEILCLTGENCTSLEGLYCMTDLRELYLSNYVGPTEGLRHLTKLEILELDINRPVTGETLSHLKNLKELCVKNMELREEMFDNLKQITAFSCADCDIDGQHLLKLENLKNLSLIRITNVADDDIRSLRNLTSLNIDSCGILTGNCVRNLTKLKKLALVNCHSVGDRDFRCLSKLEEIELAHCDLITDALFANIPLTRKVTIRTCKLEGNFPQYIPNLEDLTVIDCPGIALCGWIGLITPGFEYKSLCPEVFAGKIEILHVRGDWHIGAGILNLSNLKVLELCGNEIDGAVVGQLTQLTDLYISNCPNVSDEDIGGLVNLTNLFVDSSPQFFGTCLGHFEKLAKLTIYDCENFDEGNLTNFTELEQLTVMNPLMTGAGLSNFTYIGDLNLFYCDNLQQEHLDHIHFGRIFGIATPIDTSLLGVRERF